MRWNVSAQLARLGFGHPILWAFVGIMAIVALVTYLVMVDAQRRLIEDQALKVAEVVARQSLAARTVYSAQVVDKLRRDGFDASVHADTLPGHVPLPAQFLKLVGQESSARSAGLFTSRPISRWNLEVSQGLSDAFLRWGWQQLSAQDREQPGGPIDWQPAWRFEQVKGVPTLRYLRADPASSAGCVNCHNAYERTPDIRARRVADGVAVDKQWRQHQLLGAIEVSVPVDRVEALAASQTRRTLLMVLAITVLGLIAASVFALRDIRRRQRASLEFEHQARHDPLTHLPNRTCFAEAVSREIEHCRDASSELAVLFVDIDRFKTINDSLGHQAGDAVLKAVARRLVSGLRRTDIVGRHSGDEFTAMIRNPGSSADLQRIAIGLTEALSQPLRVRGNLLNVSASIGVSRFPAHGEDVETLLKHADTAMYRAKRNGRNLVEVYHPDMDRQVIASLALVSGMRQALEREEFVLHYQPRVRTCDGQVTSVEALLRWKHPEHGLLLPGRFLGFAEDGGVIGAIGEWALRRALRQAHDWSARGLPEFRVAVNVSPRQFLADDFVERLSMIIAQSGVSARRLELELTEGTLIDDHKRVAETLSRCHELGTYLSLDDFGTGYSSLAYLKRFPIDCLKIDKSFVDGLPDDANDRVLTRAIIGVARSLGLVAVAEGVETERQLQCLQEQGCEEVQGYLFGRPMSATQLQRWLLASPWRDGLDATRHERWTHAT